ncbi:MAG: archaeosortase/exosortase family protein [Bacteroidota bacterium]
MANRKPLSLFKAFFTDPNWEKVRGIFWFVVITMVVHFLWRSWSIDFNFAPITKVINGLRIILVEKAYDQSVFLCQHILKIKIQPVPDQLIIVNNFILRFPESASGLKQMIQFVVLMLIVSGKWKTKLWYIPFGIVIIYLTNIFRIISHVVVAIHWPQQLRYAHDNYLKLIFYVVIFVLYIVWIEEVNQKTQPENSQ